MSSSLEALIAPTTDPSRAAVLIVDDNASKRLALRAVLAPLGHQVVEADSGRSALRCLLNQQFAVILLDVRMPSMNGFETATIIRQRRQSELTPIIFVTAHAADEMDTTQRYAEGAVDFLTSPVRPDELRAKVSAFANLYLQAQALESRSRHIETRADQWRVLLDHLPVGIFCTDDAGRYTYINDEWSAMTGIPEHDAIGRTSEVLEGSVHVGDPGPRSSPLAPGSRHIQIVADPGAPPVTFVVTTRPFPAVGGRSAGWAGTLTHLCAEPGDRPPVGE